MNSCTAFFQKSPFAQKCFLPIVFGMTAQRSLLLSWILQLTAAGLLLQTLFFKFTAHPDSVAIFTTLGVEPGGRILVGMIELAVAILLLFAKTAVWGALFGVVTMIGALMGHLTQLGFEGPLGTLAGMAVIVMLACLGILILRRMDISLFRHFINSKKIATVVRENPAKRA